MTEDREHTINAKLLYDIIYDFLEKNEMELEQAIGTLETIKLEMAFSAILARKDECDEEDGNGT